MSWDGSRKEALRVRRISRSKYPTIYQVVADHCGQPLTIDQTTYSPEKSFLPAHDALIFPQGVSCPALATRGRLWPAVEAAESRSDANLATHWQGVMPTALSDQAAIAMGLDFGQHLADYLASVVHLVVLPVSGDQPARLSALCTTREAGPDGFGLKNRFNLSVEQRRKRGFPISPRTELTDLRAAWAEISADHLLRSQSLPDEVAPRRRTPVSTDHMLIPKQDSACNLPGHSLGLL